MSVQERFIRYVQINTQSDSTSESIPTTQCQLDLAQLLEKEMIIMGMSNVQLTQKGYLYGELPATSKNKCSTIGFIAHMDTSPDFSGANVSPRLVENYDGGIIELNSECYLDPNEFPRLLKQKGKDLIVTDGTTLLGADDKAGIAEIMEACQYLLEHPEIPHGVVKVAFTVDEEVGRGADYFDVDGFGCDFAYTMDGGSIELIADETFNAAAAQVVVRGVSIHPGSAKDKMIHAANIAMEFHHLLPRAARAETTEGYEGFNHLLDIQGDVSETEMNYILRNHDGAKLEKQKELMLLARDLLNKRYGEGVVEVEIKDSYQNMKEVLKDQPKAVNIAKEALEKLNIIPEMEAVRGGTDGARLTFMGLPCPNLGTGGQNFHGPYEYCCVQEMELATQLILKIVELVEGEER